MEVNIQNIGVIKEASVTINNLTVIAGENDTGKSTVGKLVFSAIKANNGYKGNYGRQLLAQVESIINELYADVRRKTKRSDNEYKIIQNTLQPGVVMRTLRIFLVSLVNERDPRSTITSQLGEYFDEKLEELRPTLEGDVFNTVTGAFSRILEIAEAQPSTEQMLIRALQDTLVAEFNSTLSHATDSPSLFSFSREGQPHVSYNAASPDRSVINASAIADFEFGEATLIDTPLMLQFFDLIDDAWEYSHKRPTSAEARLLGRPSPRVQLHAKDLINKLEAAKYYRKGIIREESLLHQEISAQIDGEFVFDEDSNGFVFSRLQGKQWRQYQPINIASGIKAFGLLQLLELAGALGPDNLLIVDEPESHLHPKWQIKYAEILVELAKRNRPILVTSHSPYLIQALIHFARQKDLLDLSNFYLAEREAGGMATIKDVGNDVDLIFQKLAEPFQELLWKSKHS